MRIDALIDLPWQSLSALVAQKTGLNFPPERQSDLQRGLASAAAEFGFADVAAMAEWMLSAPLNRNQWHAIACHLTIGETYFFRERHTFEAFAKHILPELIQRRRNEGRKRLRLWSAACCSGEEPYSLAILLRELLPDFDDWHISILGTDINERFLHKATAAIYGEWSFRDCPPEFKQRYFTAASPNRFALIPQIKHCVTFAQLNLAEDNFPSIVTDTHAMDVIFCRNLLIYFTPAHVRKLVNSLHRALVDGGWLAVSPSESSQVLFHQFATANYPGTVLYQRQGAGKPATARPILESMQRNPLTSELLAPWMSVEPNTYDAAPYARPDRPITTAVAELATSIASNENDTVPTVVTDEVALHLQAADLYAQGRYAESADLLLTAHLAQPSIAQPKTFSLLTRALANQGRLHTALEWCDRWVAADKLDPLSHYLRAMVFQELGEHVSAKRSLQQVLYLEPDFILAHFALGNIARAENLMLEANKHFANAIRLLRQRPTAELLPESDGLTAGRLEEIITALMMLTHSHGAAA